MKTMERVLFIRLSAIGDILLTTPLLRLFAQQYPNTRIDFLIKEQFMPLLQYHPLIHNRILLPNSPSIKDLFRVGMKLRQNRYSVIFDLQKHWRSYFLSYLARAGELYRYKKYSIRRFALVHFKKNTYQGIPASVPLRYFHALRNLQIPWQDKPLELHFSSKENDSVAAKLPFNQNEKIIAIAPGAGRFTKQWLPNYFFELIQRLSELGFRKFLVLGGKEDEEICTTVSETTGVEIYNWCGQTSLLETAAALSKCYLLVCNDSGVMHIANAVNCKVAAVFGPTVREFGFFPWNPDSIVVEHANLYCRPCSYHGTEKCPEKHFRCMKETTPDLVFAACQSLLQKQSGVG